MTGNVPYYGGRLTPAQAYAADHPPPRPPPPPPATPATPPPYVSASATDLRLALQQLLDTGVITPQEHAELSRRVTE